MPAADRFLECELSFPNVLRHSARRLGELGSFSGIKANGDEGSYYWGWGVGRWRMGGLGVGGLFFHWKNVLVFAEGAEENLEASQGAP